MAEPAAPSPRVVFVVMSAVAPAAVVDQLAHALAPHTVLVHHDFSQAPHFALTAPNVRFVPEPRRTGWAVFGFTEGVFHSLEYALDHIPFDYLQTLSPTCLPIKPMRHFEAHVAGAAEAHFDSIDLLADIDAFMCVGYRAFTPEHTLRHRLMRRLSTLYFGPSPGRREEAGIWLRSGRARGLMPWVALAATKVFAQPAVGGHVFGPSLRPYYGSSWFGARRPVVARMVEQFHQPELRAWYSRLRIADEFLMGTLLMNLGVRRGPMNHFIQTYDEARVREFTLAELPRLRQSAAFFARKFPQDPAAPVRLALLRELAEAGRDPVLAPTPSHRAARGTCTAPPATPGRASLGVLPGAAG